MELDEKNLKNVRSGYPGEGLERIADMLFNQVLLREEELGKEELTLWTVVPVLNRLNEMGIDLSQDDAVEVCQLVNSRIVAYNEQVRHGRS